MLTMKLQSARRYFIAGTLLLMTIGGCSRSSGIDSTANNGEVRIQLSGSSTLGPLIAEIAKRYETLHSHVRVDVQTGGSSRGIADTKSGLADIGMSSRPLKQSELDGRMEWPIAMDGVCFIVNSGNPVSELTQTQIRAILNGECRNWNQVGGVDSSIVFVNRAAGRSELELVTHFFGIQPQDIHEDLIAGENQQGIKLVANTVNSISYMSVGASLDAIQRGANIRMLPLQGIAATIENVKQGKFPLSRPLILVTDLQPSPYIEEFISYAQSENVHDLVRELSYVPIQN